MVKLSVFSLPKEEPGALMSNIKVKLKMSTTRIAVPKYSQITFLMDFKYTLKTDLDC